jgi:cell wall-associated protease
MMSKRALLAFAVPLSITASFAKVQVIPKAELDLKVINNHKNFVMKNAKGTLVAPSFLNITPENWFNLSPISGVEGVRTEETYSTFGQPQSEDIIVAVIDSGVDVNHEDLQGKIWINEGEIPNNGIDDDGNGYVDDVFGWNFMGGADGMATIVKDETLANGLKLIKGNPEAQIDADTLEVTRELVRMKKLKVQVEALGEKLTQKQERYLAKIKKEVEGNYSSAQNVVANYSKRLETYQKSEAILKAAGLKEITLEALRAFSTTEAEVIEAKSEMIGLLSNGLTLARINRVLGYYSDQVSYYYNENFDPRPIVGDDYYNHRERFYGNNDVIGPDSSHGTHVAGIIAAVRDNNLGIKGVATNVKIMALRAVPNGDERDKDIANSIRYAVDNGAKIINMSFGKAYSPFKPVVDEAVRYAESKGVLLVHAAGNSSLNIDVEANFPNRHDIAKKKEFSNWLEIGASSFKKGPKLPAEFSNYGKKSVDFFAPGVDILSTTPDNSYDTYSGTSMAAPTAAGVAALTLSYNNGLSASSLRTLMIDTSRRYPNLKVLLPGTQTEVLFSSLSSTGTVVDGFEAIANLKK